MRSSMLVGAENAALTEHGVHQRGFPMVDVRNDGNITNCLVVLQRFAMISSGESTLRVALVISYL